MFLFPQFLMLARQANPSFNPLTSSLSGLCGALSTMKPDSFVQGELDKLSFNDAFRYVKAIQYLVDEKTSLCYTHFDLGKFIATLEDSSDLDATDTYWLTYTSKTFRARAAVFCIAPRSQHHHLGFIQHCTGKDSTAYFDDGSYNSRVASLAFPIGDCAGPAHAPFYYRPSLGGGSAHGNKTIHPPYIDLMGKSGWQNLEMNDYFRLNPIPRHPKSSGGNTAAAFKLASHLTYFERSQSFVCWVGRINPNNEEKLLYEVRYHLINEVNFNHVTNTTSLKTDSSSIEFSGAPALKRPIVSSNVMNGAETLKYYSHIGAIPVNV
jgi:hypothetical protein